MMNIICCDNCSTNHKINSITNVHFTCNYCEHSDTYYYMNSYFYSFFISKTKFEMFTIDKKQEYIKTNKINNFIHKKTLHKKPDFNYINLKEDKKPDFNYINLKEDKKPQINNLYYNNIFNIFSTVQNTSIKIFNKLYC